MEVALVVGLRFVIVEVVWVAGLVAGLQWEYDR
jgi:hypothetical protein